MTQPKRATGIPWWLLGAVAVIWIAVLLWFAYQKTQAPAPSDPSRSPVSPSPAAEREMRQRWDQARQADPRYVEAEQTLLERYKSNVKIQIEGSPAEACLTGGPPGSSCANTTRTLRFENLGPGLLAVYYRLDNDSYYVLGKAKIHPTAEIVEYGVVDKDGHALGSKEWWK